MQTPDARSVEFLTLPGEVDIACCEDVGERIVAALDCGCDVVVDLSDCTFLDASMLQALLDGYHIARERGLGFAALVPFTSARVVLMLAFDLAPELVPYPVVPSRSAALRALSEPATMPLDVRRIHGLRARAWDIARRNAELRSEHDVLVMELRSRLQDRHVAAR